MEKKRKDKFDIFKSLERANPEFKASFSPKYNRLYQFLKMLGLDNWNPLARVYVVMALSAGSNIEKVDTANKRFDSTALSGIMSADIEEKRRSDIDG
jgi:hypothetical protein